MAPAPAMDVFPEPGQQGGRVPGADGFGQAGDLVFYGRKELGCVKAAQAVGGEITKTAMAPVNVLQTASFIVRDGDTQPRCVVFVPPAGDIGYGKAAFDELLFQFVSDHDMEMIRDLVGFSADQGGLYFIDGLVELPERDGAQ